MVANCVQNSRSLSPCRVHGAAKRPHRGRNAFPMHSKGNALRPGLGIENCRSAGYASTDAGLEVAPHPGGNRVGTAVGLEALEVEAQMPDPLPEVGIVDVAAVFVER